MHDEATPGIVQNRMRPWHIQLGRFITVDPTGYPDGLNAYAGYHILRGGYDPYGLAWYDDVWEFVKQAASDIADTSSNAADFTWDYWTGGDQYGGQYYSDSVISDTISGGGKFGQLAKQQAVGAYNQAVDETTQFAASRFEDGHSYVRVATESLAHAATGLVGAREVVEGFTGVDISAQRIIEGEERGGYIVIGIVKMGGTATTLYGGAVRGPLPAGMRSGALYAPKNVFIKGVFSKCPPSNVSKNIFPKIADDLLPKLSRDAKGRIYPNSNTRIRPESHPMKPGETYAPRHHGQHYHVEIRLDLTKSWNNSKNVIKIKPDNYVPGEGTGFLPGEPFPGQ